MHLFMVASENSLIDVRTNNLSIINIIEELHSPIFPFVLPRMVISFLLEREQNESVSQTELKLSMGDSLIFHAPLDIDFQGRQRTRAVADINNLVIPAPGDLVLTHTVNEMTEASWTITVQKIGEQGADLFVTPAGGSAK